MNMRGKSIGRALFRFFFTLLGVGVGVLTAEQLFPVLQEYYSWINEANISHPLSMVICGLLFGTVFFALSYTIAISFDNTMHHAVRSLDLMTTREIALSMVGLVAGLSIAALCSILVLAAGQSLLTISFCALMYVAMGYTGLYIAQRRFRKRRKQPEQDRLEKLLAELPDDDELLPLEELPGKLIDSSVLIDGRLEGVIRAGFLEGPLILPRFVLLELQKLADSTQEDRRRLGRRGLAAAEKLCAACPVTLQEEALREQEPVDVALLRLCKEKGFKLLTNDVNLMRLCAVDGIQALSLCALAEALRPPVTAGEKLRVQLSRKGKEPGQGIGHLEDGTMVVAAGGSSHIGETVELQITQVRTTAAGRILFGELAREEEPGGSQRKILEQKGDVE